MRPQKTVPERCHKIFRIVYQIGPAEPALTVQTVDGPFDCVYISNALHWFVGPGLAQHTIPMPTPHQPELFPLTSGFRPDAAFTEPRLWVRELRVYRMLSPGDQNILRRISLRPGLNVLWARPGDRTRAAQLHTPGVSGHGTGKTTFCRFIRHVLGEPTFGNEEQRGRLRSTFPEGWIVAEVRLAGESWLVCRPFKIGPHAICYRGRTIESLFADETGRTPWDEYLRALDAALAEPLPVATFAANPTPIRWVHILQWLSRDQECRFASLAELRHPDSESLAPDMAVEDRHFLFRAVLGLIDTAEQAELENNKTLLARRNLAEKNAPLFRFRSESALKRLRKQWADFRTDLEGADFLEAMAGEGTHRADDADAALTQLGDPETLQTARTTLIREQAALHAARLHVSESEGVLEWIAAQRRNLKGETTDAQLAEFVQRNFTPDRYCSQSLAAAIEFSCPLVRGRLLPAETVQEPSPAAQAEQLDTRERTEKLRLDAARQKAAEIESAAQTAATVLQQEMHELDRRRGVLLEEAANGRALAAEAQRALVDQQEADKLEQSLGRLDKQIRASLEAQAAVRDQNRAALSVFGDGFGRVARAVLGDQVRGEIRFRGRQVRPTLTDRIDLSSAALETLKIICFDLAALIQGVERGGGHPRFLLHDGPREADMDAELYQRLFLLVVEMERAFEQRPLSFQYIVTTTEPPPPEVQTDPWLLAPTLSAVTPQGKFLGEDF